MTASTDRFLPFDPATLRDATVVLHGATGAVGSAVFARLREAGARIAVPVRRAWQVDELRGRLDGGEGLVAVVGNRDSEAAAGFAKGVADSLGAVTALVSTAGAFSMQAIGGERAGEELDLVEANWLSLHNLVRAFAPAMRRREKGALVFTGAAAVGTAGGANMALYLGTKAALHEYARCLSNELAPVGIAVAVIAPGVVDTDANRQAMPDADRSDWTSIDRLCDALLGAAARATPGAVDPVHRLAPDGGARKR